MIALAGALASCMAEGDRVLLEGPMGAGKSTFARALLQALEIDRVAEGSPTFALVHEYRSSRGDVAHMDFYRLRSEAEIEEAGIPSYFWEREMIVLAEWVSLWPEFEKAVLKKSSEHRVWRVDLDFAEAPERRIIEIRLQRA